MLAAADDEQRIEIVQEEIEEAWDRPHLCELDKAWDAIHRCLTDGTLNPGDPPLGLALLGGRQLYEGDDYIMNFVAAREVPGIVAAAGRIDKAELRRRFDAMLDNAGDEYDGSGDEDDFAYTWSNFTDFVAFLRHAAQARRSVLFTVDQ